MLVLIVEDHTMFIEGLQAILKDQVPEDEVHCDKAADVASARVLLAEKRYDLALLDIAMPGMSGIEFLPELTAGYPDMPVLMLSMYSEEQFAMRALQAGARGYITKQAAADELLIAIKTISQGGRYLSRSFSANLLEQFLAPGGGQLPRHYQLSKREYEIFYKLASGQSLKNIGVELGLSIKTVSTYKARLSAKMGFSSTADLIRYAMRHQL